MAWLKKLLLTIAKANQEEFGPDISYCLREALKREQLKRNTRQQKKGED